MVTASERLSKHPLYRNDFYVEGGKLFCRFCQDTIRHEKKSIIDNHLESNSHKAKRHLIENRPNTTSLPLQRSISSFLKPSNEREQFVLDFVQILTEADIPIEKVKYFLPFLMEHCKNSMF